jgi:hypothetical protein
MRRETTPRLALAAAALLAAAAVSAAAPKAQPAARPEKKPEVLIEARPPPFSEGIFPCMDCHQDQKDGTRRELGFHEEQQAIFDHDAEHRWCLDCHNLDEPGRPPAREREPVPFTESYRLCGQCHGDKYRDWRAGVHGKRTGMWDGPKTYYLCVHCHDPHSPRFNVRWSPSPPPVRPEEMRR